MLPLLRFFILMEEAQDTIGDERDSRTKVYRNVSTHSWAIVSLTSG